MCSKAVITTKDNFKNNGVGVSIHWKGELDSVACFLEYCKRKRYSSPDSDCYGWARLC